MFKKASVLISSLVLVLMFQNCTSQESFKANLRTMQSLVADPILQADGGNGQHYGGKILPGRYVRPLTERVCDSGIKNLGEIIVTETSVQASIVDLQTCAYREVSVELSDFVHSEYNQGRIGLLEGIYTNDSVSSGPGAADKAIEEVWCRETGSSVTTGYDVVVRADYNKQLFTARIHSASIDSSGQLQTREFPERLVERRFEDQERVRYRTDQGFDLEIRRRDYNAADGTMTAVFKIDEGGVDVERSLRCRLGGELDVMLPAN